MMRHALLLTTVVVPVAVAASCGGGGGSAQKDPGALVDVSMESQVGVVLDEIPALMRDRVTEALLAKPADFWKARAVSQAKLTTVRLVFRRTFYDDPKDSLPLTLPKLWDITLEGKPKRGMVDGHDVVQVGYTLKTTLLTSEGSPAKSEPALAKVGGIWQEDFVLPVDPELLLQRTGYACMDENEFPPNSVDSEEVDSFYDDTCGVESEKTHTACHYSALPQLSCVDALKAKVGRVEANLRFERKAWDAEAAQKARSGDITTDAGANLAVFTEEFRENRLVYRYIQPDSCTLVENCVGGAGWRRLLQFSTSDINTGNATLTIGSVDYFGADDAGTPLSQHGVFEWSACHAHFHFTHYGSFSYGNGDEGTQKRGFCLQSTLRTSNNELSPLSNDFYDCGYQGVEVGWADQYKAGLECQWIDVTKEDTSTTPVTKSLSFHSNPDGFLCEGQAVLDASGKETWVPTGLTTATGQPVDKPACTYSPGYEDDNVDAYMVTLPLSGNGFVTAPCQRGQLGPLRNCGLAKQDDSLKCTPGAAVNLSCKLPADGTIAQVVRVCETSAVLKTGIPCIYDQALAVGTVEPAAPVTVSFTCPAARDAQEPGGGYALYTGPAFPDDASQMVTCTPM